MFEKYYTPEQLEYLAKRGEEVGAERIEEVQREWQELFARCRAEMERGTDPSDPRVKPLVEKSAALVEEFTGGDPGIHASLSRMYQSEGSTAVLQEKGKGMDPGSDLWSFMGKASKAHQKA